MTRALFGRRTQVNKLPVCTSRSAGVRAGPPAAISACDPASPTRPRRALPWLQAAPCLIAVARAGSGERGQGHFVGGISLLTLIWHGHSDAVGGCVTRVVLQCTTQRDCRLSAALAARREEQRHQPCAEHPSAEVPAQQVPLASRTESLAPAPSPGRFGSHVSGLSITHVLSILRGVAGIGAHCSLLADRRPSCPSCPQRAPAWGRLSKPEAGKGSTCSSGLRILGDEESEAC